MLPPTRYMDRAGSASNTRSPTLPPIRVPSSDAVASSTPIMPATRLLHTVDLVEVDVEEHGHADEAEAEHPDPHQLPAEGPDATTSRRTACPEAHPRGCARRGDHLPGDDLDHLVLGLAQLQAPQQHDHARDRQHHERRPPHAVAVHEQREDRRDQRADQRTERVGGVVDRQHTVPPRRRVVVGEQRTTHRLHRRLAETGPDPRQQQAAATSRRRRWRRRRRSTPPQRPSGSWGRSCLVPR